MNSIKTLVLVLAALNSDFTRIHNVAIITGDAIKIIFIINHFNHVLVIYSLTKQITIAIDKYKTDANFNTFKLLEIVDFIFSTSYIQTNKITLTKKSSNETNNGSARINGVINFPKM